MVIDVKPHGFIAKPHGIGVKPYGFITNVHDFGAKGCLVFLG
jgi:hypothetical protein